MNLKNLLRSAGYDLIESPIRNHKTMQLWIKKTFDEIELYYEHISHAFVSDTPLSEVTNEALNVNSTQKNEYNFNIGITVLENVLKSLGLGNIEFTTKIKNGKTVTISYDNSITKEYPMGVIENYMSTADFKYNNPTLLKNANHDFIVVVSGIVFAKNLVVEIEVNSNFSAELIASLNSIAEGKLGFSMINQSKLKMVSNGTGYFPIAVKASRVIFDKGTFKDLILVTDTRNYF